MNVLTIPSIKPSSSSEAAFTGAETGVSGTVTAETTGATISDAAVSKTSPSTTGIGSLSVVITSTFSGTASMISATGSASFSPFSETTSTGITFNDDSGTISLVKISAEVGSFAGMTGAAVTTAASGAMAATTGFLVVSSSKKPARNSSPIAAKVPSSSLSSSSSDYN